MTDFLEKKEDMTQNFRRYFMQTMNSVLSIKRMEVSIIMHKGGGVCVK